MPDQDAWRLSDRFDWRALPLADRHYNRRKVGSPQFVPPGRCLVLLTEGADALWVTSWPYAEHVRHAWAGAWVNSLFRNEAQPRLLSSDLIREAVGVTRWRFGDPPDVPWPFVTFIDRDKTRRKRDPGRCYLRAGWQVIGETKGGLLALGLAPEDMNEPVEPIGAQTGLAI
jgi:hypothetical protein